MDSSEEPGKRHSYTIDFKLKLLEWYHNNGENKGLTSRVFNVQPKRVSEWLIIEQQLRNKKGSGGGKRESPESTLLLRLQVDKVLLQWYKEKNAEGIKPTLNQVRSKALELATGMGYSNFKASSSWVKQWKKRHAECGEIADDENKTVHVVTISPPLSDDEEEDEETGEEQQVGEMSGSDDAPSNSGDERVRDTSAPPTMVVMSQV